MISARSPNKAWAADCSDMLGACGGSNVRTKPALFLPSVLKEGLCPGEPEAGP